MAVRKPMMRTWRSVMRMRERDDNEENGTDNEDEKDKEEKDNMGQEKEVVMDNVIKDDDNEGVNEKSKDMNKAEVNKQDTQEDIQSDGPK